MAYNAQFDLRGKRIEDTYTQVLQYDTSSGASYTGQGLQLDVSASYAPQADLAVSASRADSTFSSENVISNSDISINANGGTNNVTTTGNTIVLNGNVQISGSLTTTNVNNNMDITTTYGTLTVNSVNGHAVFNSNRGTTIECDSSDITLYAPSGDIRLNAGIFTNAIYVNRPTAIMSSTPPTKSLEVGGEIVCSNLSASSANFTGVVNATNFIATTSVQSLEVTASMYSAESSSLSPTNQTTASAWMPIQIAGQTFYIPLYQ